MMWIPLNKLCTTCHLLFSVAAISMSSAFNIDVTNSDIISGEKKDFFGYKVLQFMSSTNKGWVIKAALLHKYEKYSCISDKIHRYTDKNRKKVFLMKLLWWAATAWFSTFNIEYVAHTLLRTTDAFLLVKLCFTFYWTVSLNVVHRILVSAPLRLNGSGGVFRRDQDQKENWFSPDGTFTYFTLSIN